MPSKYQDTLYHALFLAQHLSKCDVQDGLVYILLELRLPSYTIGYQYVRTAILLFYRDPVHSLSRGVYQLVAETLNLSSTYQQIEQNMRHVIQQARRECDPQVWNYYFKPKNKRRGKGPSNLEFISQIANFMELWQACCKEVSYEI